ncbi:MAG: hypothetical protein V4686_03225 [Patescibacteria group bacterium]
MQFSVLTHIGFITSILIVAALISWFTRKGVGLDKYTWRTTNENEIRRDERYQFWMMFAFLSICLMAPYAAVFFR